MIPSLLTTTFPLNNAVDSVELKVETGDWLMVTPDAAVTEAALIALAEREPVEPITVTLSALMLRPEAERAPEISASPVMSSD